MTQEEIKQAAHDYSCQYRDVYHYRELTSCAFIAGAEANSTKWYTIEEREPVNGEYLVVKCEDETFTGFVEVKGHSIWLGPQGLAKDYIDSYTFITSPPNTKS